MTRSAMIAAIVLLCASPAHAVTCKQVIEWVAKYGEANVIAYAKWQGYSEARIAHAKRCLK